MNILLATFGWILILWTLLDAFEQVILPRTESHVFRISSLALLCTWGPWKALARRIRSAERRAAFLSYYGPLSVLILLASWDLSLILGFSLGWWSTREGSFATRFYVSGSNFFALGLSPTPVTDIARLTTLVEAGLGLALLAVIIGYLPVYYGAYSTREAFIIRFQSAAGSPSTALQVLKEFAPLDQGMRLQLLMEFQTWAAQVLQSQRSYALVTLYRSQKGNESWLAVLTVILDACALWMTVPQNKPQHGPKATFDVALRAVTDLASAFRLEAKSPPSDRLPSEECQKLLETLSQSGVKIDNHQEAEFRLAKIRNLYEPYVYAISVFLMTDLPAWAPANGTTPNSSTEEAV